jgi:hypothetical protein
MPTNGRSRLATMGRERALTQRRQPAKNGRSCVPIHFPTTDIRLRGHADTNCRFTRPSGGTSVLICSDAEAAKKMLMAHAKLIKNHLGLAFEIHGPPRSMDFG